MSRSAVDPPSRACSSSPGEFLVHKKPFRLAVLSKLKSSEALIDADIRMRCRSRMVLD